MKIRTTIVVEVPRDLEDEVKEIAPLTEAVNLVLFAEEGYEVESAEEVK